MLLFVLLMGLFLTKHGMLTSVIDLGYSDSRSPANRLWLASLALYLASETTLTLYLLHEISWQAMLCALTVENIALIGGTIAERRAPLRKLLRVHVISELIIIFMYIIFSSLWSDIALNS